MKNKKQLFIITILLSLIFLTACNNSNEVTSFITDEVNPQINVFGVQLFMEESKVHEIIGKKGERAMCIYGYEYEYAENHINIGFNQETEKVRRITTKNPNTSIYGIVPGVELDKAYEIMDQQGFKKSNSSKYMFYKDSIRITLVSMKSTHADGVILEINPE